MRHLAFVILIVFAILLVRTASADDATNESLNRQFVALRPVLAKFCLECHSPDQMEGE